MKKGYIFDLGRVLANFNLDIAFTKFLEFSVSFKSIEDIKALVFSEQNKHIILNYEFGEISSSEFYEQWSLLLQLKINEEKFLEIWGSVFSENLAFVEVLEMVKNSPKVILSNIDPCQSLE